MKRVVLDTNTIISGFLWHGNEEKLLELIDKNKVKSCTSKEILKEIAEVIYRPKFKQLLIKADLKPKEILEKITEKSVVLKPKVKVNAVKEDPADNKFIECALEAKVQYIISGDTHLLKLKKFKAIKIIKTKEFLKKIKNKTRSL